MKLIANLVKNKSRCLIFLLLLFNISIFGQDAKDCEDCPFCEPPSKCTGNWTLYKMVCERDSTCNRLNKCEPKCQYLSNNKNKEEKSMEVGQLTLWFITDKFITSDELEKYREEYALLIQKLLSNKISENTYQVEYETKLVKIGYTKEGLELITKFKEELQAIKPNSRRKSRNPLVIIWRAIT